MAGLVVLPLASGKENTKQKHPLGTGSGYHFPKKLIKEVEQQDLQVNISADILLLPIKTSHWSYL